MYSFWLDYSRSCVTKWKWVSALVQQAPARKSMPVEELFSVGLAIADRLALICTSLCFLACSQNELLKNTVSSNDKKTKGRTGWPQHVWALELKQWSILWTDAEWRLISKILSEKNKLLLIYVQSPLLSPPKNKAPTLWISAEKHSIIWRRIYRLIAGAPGSCDCCSICLFCTENTTQDEDPTRLPGIRMYVKCTWLMGYDN